MGRFETEVLTQPGNLKALTKLSGKWIDRRRERQPLRELILDLDSSVSETYGEQEGTAFNGHFGCTCYHPLFCFNQSGDAEQSLLREGNVHSAKNWRAGVRRWHEHRQLAPGARPARDNRQSPPAHHQGSGLPSHLRDRTFCGT